MLLSDQEQGVVRASGCPTCFQSGFLDMKDKLHRLITQIRILP